ncbi:hypothetical protein AYI70_g5815 [Smittium culicis]|uniref:Uncharacterized protein n=1 Tax=Smittium culicis TaxID=133412 RepID=A0A1R1XT17_9FUNG|nr:hypothetical protein AYI70_g5815 [Smittium culicis]
MRAWSKNPRRSLDLDSHTREKKDDSKFFDIQNTSQTETITNPKQQTCQTKHAIWPEPTEAGRRSHCWEQGVMILKIV